MYKTKLLNIKTRKKQSVRVEVTAIDKAKKTVTVKRTDTKALVKGIAWTDLEVE